MDLEDHTVDAPDSLSQFADMLLRASGIPRSDPRTQPTVTTPPIQPPEQTQPSPAMAVYLSRQNANRLAQQNHLNQTPSTTANTRVTHQVRVGPTEVKVYIEAPGAQPGQCSISWSSHFVPTVHVSASDNGVGFRRPVSLTALPDILLHIDPSCVGKAPACALSDGLLALTFPARSPAVHVDKQVALFPRPVEEVTDPRTAVLRSLDDVD